LREEFIEGGLKVPKMSLSRLLRLLFVPSSLWWRCREGVFSTPRLPNEEGRDGEGGMTLWTRIVLAVDRDVGVFESSSEGEREGTKRRAEGEEREEKKGREGV